MTEVALPEFEMDCRDWFVSRPDPSDDASEAPVVATLSTVVIDGGIREASGSITLGVLEPTDLPEMDAYPVAPGGPACEVLADNPEPGTRRYVVPAPTPASETRLALLAEFSVPNDTAAELDRRVHALMGSFRWLAA